MAGRTFVNGKEILAAEDLTLTDDLIVGDDATITDDTDIGGTLTLSTDGKIVTTGNGDLTLLPNGTGITIVGDAGSALKLGTPTNDDMFVAGRHETRGVSYNTSTATAVATEYGSKTHDGDDVIHSVGKGGHVFKTDAQKARGTMTLTGLPTADDTFVINATTITAKADGSGNVDHFTIGGTAAATVTNIVATLAECSESANLTAWDGAGDTVVIEWGTAGVAGNAIVFTEAMDNTTVDGAGTLGTTHAGIAAATLLDVDEGGTTTAGPVVADYIKCDAGAADGYRVRTLRNGTDFLSVYVINDDGTHLGIGSADNKANRHLILVDSANVAEDYDHSTRSTDPTLFIQSVTAAGTATDEFATLRHNEQTISGGSGSYCANKSITEEVTIAVGVGVGSAGVVTSGNLSPANSYIKEVLTRVTQAPGGGATTLDVGRTNGGNLDEAADGTGVALNTTTMANNDGDGNTTFPVWEAGADTLTLTTDADVTVSDMKVRVTVFYEEYTAHTG